MTGPIFLIGYRGAGKTSVAKALSAKLVWPWFDADAILEERAGKSIPLTPREYALLQFLAFHRGKVVTRSMIWEHLYDEHDENTSNVVDVYIRYLRNKIDKGFTPELIHTVRGAGYCLRAPD
jgi:DNA-binding response OmpR family regulator